MIVKLLTEHHLEFLSLTGGCGSSSESTLVKMSNCWKSHAAAHFVSGMYTKDKNGGWQPGIHGRHEFWRHQYCAFQKLKPV